MRGFPEADQRQLPAMKTLMAKLPGGGGRVKVEAGAARAHDLDATDAAIKSNQVSSRCHLCQAE